ncbi:MAG: DNA adenine methylase [Synergistaceae bacterium]|jgi:DNA adenine methylase|nr:DNA adenine methylase [Synergistaceae bacterium]
MNGRIPHIVQYQGSKRMLASEILRYMPKKFNRLIEPFSGMAAISIAVAFQKRANEYHINDLNEPIVCLLQTVIENPAEIVDKYKRIWEEQFNFPDGHIEHFNYIRELFNAGDKSAENMLYLLARCVKGAVRYGKNRNFNQSPDKRRNGTKPTTIATNVHAISHILKGRVLFSALDYRRVLEIAKPGDLVYMDPPYQGVTNTRDNRYFSGVNFDEFVSAVAVLNRNQVDYIISYDGICGEKEYGSELPQELNCTKILLDAGLSTQATLLGKRHTTYEALYISQNLSLPIDITQRQLTLLESVV